MKNKYKTHGFITLGVCLFSFFFFHAIFFVNTTLRSLQQQLSHIQARRHCYFQAKSGLISANLLKNDITPLFFPAHKESLYTNFEHAHKPFSEPHFALFKTNTHLFSVVVTDKARCILTCSYTREGNNLVLSNIIDFRE